MSMGVSCDATTGVSVKFYGGNGCKGAAATETTTKACDAVTSYGTTTVITATCGSSPASAAAPNVAAIVVPIIVGLALIGGGAYWYLKIRKPKASVLSSQAPTGAEAPKEPAAPAASAPAASA